MSKPLIDAIVARDLDRLAELLAAGESPNAPFSSQHKVAPLQHAVASLQSTPNWKPGSIDAVVLLLRYGADADGWDADRSMNALLRAVQDNHIECVRLLLAAGADTNARGDEGETALRLCAQNGFLEIARLVLRCGVDIHMAAGGDGMNALGLAATRLDVEMVKLLLEFGADPQAEDVDYLTVYDHLGFMSVPDDPAEQERFHEICRLLGAELVPSEP